MSISKYCADTFLPPLVCLSISSSTSIGMESTITDNASSAVERTLYGHIMITVYGQSYDFHLPQFNVHRSTMHYLGLTTCIHLFMSSVTIHLKSGNGHMGPNTLVLKFVSQFHIFYLTFTTTCLLLMTTMCQATAQLSLQFLQALLVLSSSRTP